MVYSIIKGEFIMITSIISLKNVNGGYAWLIFFAVFALMYFFIAKLIYKNREKRCMLAALIAFDIAAIITDIAWYLIFYPSGSYQNLGIGGAMWLLLWPIMLAIAFFISLLINNKKST